MDVKIVPSLSSLRATALWTAIVCVLSFIYLGGATATCHVGESYALFPASETSVQTVSAAAFIRGKNAALFHKLYFSGQPGVQVVVGSNNGVHICVLDGSYVAGGGTCTIVAGSAEKGYATSLAIARLEKNSLDQGIVAAHYTEQLPHGRIVWYKIDSRLEDGTSTSKVLLSTSAAVGDVRIVDVDGDGDMDVIAFIEDTGLVYVEHVDGMGMFGNTAVLISNSSVVSVRFEVADMDRDGDVDVISCSYEDNSVRVIENAGVHNNDQLVWTEHLLSTGSAVSPSDVRVADLNGDHVKDVLVCYNTDKAVKWFEGSLNGTSIDTYSERIVDSDVIRPRIAHCADADNDGDVDILLHTATNTQGNITWYENDGKGSFVKAVVVSSRVTDCPVVTTRYGPNSGSYVDPAWITKDEIMWSPNPCPQYVASLKMSSTTTSGETNDVESSEDGLTVEEVFIDIGIAAAVIVGIVCCCVLLVYLIKGACEYEAPILTHAELKRQEKQSNKREKNKKAKEKASAEKHYRIAKNDAARFGVHI